MGREGSGSMTTPPGVLLIVGVAIVVVSAVVVSTVSISTVVISTCHGSSFVLGGSLFKEVVFMSVLDSTVSVSLNWFTGDAAVVQSSVLGWVGGFSVIWSLVDSGDVLAAPFSRFKASRHFAA